MALFLGDATALVTRPPLLLLWFLLCTVWFAALCVLVAILHTLQIPHALHQGQKRALVHLYMAAREAILWSWEDVPWQGRSFLWRLPCTCHLAEKVHDTPVYRSLDHKGHGKPCVLLPLTVPPFLSPTEHLCKPRLSQSLSGSKVHQHVLLLEEDLLLKCTSHIQSYMAR